MNWWFPELGHLLKCKLMIFRGAIFLTMAWWFPEIGHLLKCYLMILRGGPPYLCIGLFWVRMYIINKKEESATSKSPLLAVCITTKKMAASNLSKMENHIFESGSVWECYAGTISQTNDVIRHLRRGPNITLMRFYTQYFLLV